VRYIFIVVRLGRAIQRKQLFSAKSIRRRVLLRQKAGDSLGICPGRDVRVEIYQHRMAQKVALRDIGIFSRIACIGICSKDRR
jgi:hypothetical protein